jgi:hypothetical protein
LRLSSYFKWDGWISVAEASSPGNVRYTPPQPAGRQFVAVDGGGVEERTMRTDEAVEVGDAYPLQCLLEEQVVVGREQLDRRRPRGGAGPRGEAAMRCPLVGELDSHEHCDLRANCLIQVS